MKKCILFLLWGILSILNEIFLILGSLASVGASFLGGAALLVFIISILMKRTDSFKFVIIAAICFSLKSVISFIYGFIRGILGRIDEKIKEL